MEAFDLKRGAYKNLSLRLSRQGVLKVTAPWFLPRFVIDAFVSEKAGWIEQKRKELSQLMPLQTAEDKKGNAEVRARQKAAVADALDQLVPFWAGRMGLTVKGWKVKHLRSRWGSCRPDTGTLVFNAHLAELPPECLEHVVVHELVHLIEASHNARFHALVEHWLPGSATVRAMLKKGIATDGSGVFRDPPSKAEEETAP